MGSLDLHCLLFTFCLELVFRSAEAGDSLWVSPVFFGMVKTHIVLKLRRQCRSFGSQGTWKLNQGTIELRNFAGAKQRVAFDADFTSTDGGDSWLWMILSIVLVNVGWNICFDVFFWSILVGHS